MLKKVSLVNFQSHADTELEFVPGVNVILGASDKGKTAILRAMEWVRTNRPLGDSMIRRDSEGKPQASVRVCLLLDGCDSLGLPRTVGRFKDKQYPDYMINGHNYSAVNKGVPEPAREMLWQDINVQGQLDSHFMILDPSSQAARAINEATGLHEVDAIIKVLAGRQRQDSTRRKFLAGENERVQEQLDHPVYARLEDYRELLNRLDSLEQLRTRLNEDVLNLGAIVSNVLVLQEQLDRIKVLTQKQKARLDNLREDAQEILSRRQSLEREEGTISGLFGRIKDGEEALHSLRGPDKELVERLVCESHELKEGQTGLVQMRYSLLAAMEYVTIAIKDLAFCESAMAAEQDELIDSVSSLISEEQLCPVCLTHLEDSQQIETTVVNLCRLFGV